MPLSLVAYYGEKPESLVCLIKQLQDYLAQELSTAFRPYAMSQVHGTVLGMESIAKERNIYSRWFLENKEKDAPIDFKKLTSFLQKDLPEVSIKIGGYQARQDYHFTSRNRHPYQRSFSIQGKIAVAMGWPVEMKNEGETVYSNDLYLLRKAFESFNLCHKWNKGDYQDNDFFFVLGKIEREKLDPNLLDRTAEVLRQMLAETEEVVYINQDSLSIVSYEDTELPLESTTAFSLTDNNFSERLLLELFALPDPN